jgi:gamma-glutamyl-gamma-aminobutyrate hydrolase PuuD
MQENKIIGLPIWNQGETSVGATKAYLEYLKQFGDVILLTPNAFIPEIDLLVLPGGKDVMGGGDGDYSFYNSDGERFLEHFDKYTLPKYIENGTPIFGICRGFQAILKYFNIPLVQDIKWDHGYSTDETKTEENKLIIPQKFQGLAQGTTKVGSWHHQCLSIQEAKNNANYQNNFETIAYTHDNKNGSLGCVEYMKHLTLPISGCQTHPERNYNMLEYNMINELLNFKNLEK